MLESGVGGEDGVVGLDDGGGDLRGGVDCEFELCLLSVVDRKSLHQERSETRAGSATEGVEDEETLETSAVVGELSDAIKDVVDDFLADGVVATGVVVGRVLLASDQLLGVVEALVGALAN